MKERTPKISVGMPVYNGEQYLEQAIDSIRKQTLDDFELIINDNASTDHTEEISRDLAAKDSRIRYERNTKNVGAAGNYRLVFQRSRAEYFRWMNADDLCASNSHELCLAALEADPTAVLTYGRTVIIGSDGEFLDDYEDKLDLQQDSAPQRFEACLRRIGLTNVIYGLMRSTALKRTALMGDGSFPAADINLVAELTHYGKFVQLPDQLFSRRMHPGASSWDRADDQAQLDFWMGEGASAHRFPRWKRSLALLRGARRAPLSAEDHRQIRRRILRGMVWNRANLLKDIVIEVARPFRRSRQE